MPDIYPQNLVDNPWYNSCKRLKYLGWIGLVAL